MLKKYKQQKERYVIIHMLGGFSVLSVKFSALIKTYVSLSKKADRRRRKITFLRGTFDVVSVNLKKCFGLPPGD